jgi:glycosyltransferase involved in cell wall biosynthesis
MVRRADNVAFSAAKAVLTSWPVTRERLHHYNGFDPQVLPPLEDHDLFMGSGSSGYIIATGRVTDGKRQHLLLRALRYAPGMRVNIAGQPKGSAYSDLLQCLVREEGLDDDRVKLGFRFLPRSELADFVNHSCAVACLPCDEDTVSYVAMEARD